MNQETNKINVINTRTNGVNHMLTQQLRKNGISVKEFPLIDIKSVEVSAKISLDKLDIIIFISQNAVEHFFKQFSISNLPESCVTVAIGAASAKAFWDITGKEIDVFPQKQFDSEHLLLHPLFNKIKGKHILIVRGVGGREYLYQALIAKGALVNYCEVYERHLPKYTSNQINQLFIEDYRNILLIFSSESLFNLLQLFGEQMKDCLLSKQLIVIHEKIKQKALSLGFCGIIEVIPTNAPNELVNYLNQFDHD